MTAGNEPETRELEAKREEPGQPAGYGKPPVSTRFRKGVSGNPKGRPRGSLNMATAFTKALREKVVINEHGQRRTVTKLEAALKQLVNKAASGDLRALAQLVDLARDSEAKQNMPGAQDPGTSDLDREVMDGIMKRFLSPGEDQAQPIEEQPEAQEEINGDDERV